MPSIKDIVRAPRRAFLGVKIGFAALLIIILLQAVIIWLLLTRLPAPTS